MRMIPLAASLAVLLAATSVHATTITDPVGDFLPNFHGTQFDDLDIRSLTVVFDPAHGGAFGIEGKLAGAIDPTHAGLYVVGVDTGLGAGRVSADFDLVFDQAILFRDSSCILQDGSTTVRFCKAGLGLQTPTLDVTAFNDHFFLIVPLSVLPSTGLNPEDYRFSFWTQGGATGNDLADIAFSATPEPGTWALMIGGFGLVGAAMRRRRAVVTA